MHHAPPRWYIPGVTPRPTRPFAQSGQRHRMRLVVFVKMGQQPIVVRTDNMAASGQAAGSSSNAAEEPPPWNAELFCSIVEEHLLGHPTNRLGRRQGPVKLVLDRDPAHKNKLFQSFASQHGMKICFLPAKAPDLDPLDYGIFGLVKQSWEKYCFKGNQRGRLSWKQQCQLLVEMLEAVGPTPAIAALPSRIDKCIAAGGSHFEG